MIRENQLSSFLTVIIQLASANRVAVLSHEPIPIAEYFSHYKEFIYKLLLKPYAEFTCIMRSTYWSRVICMVPHQNEISLRMDAEPSTEELTHKVCVSYT